MWTWFSRRHPHAIATLVGLATLGSGAIDIYSVMGPSLRDRARLLREIFPLEFLGISRFATLLIGFALIISSLNVFRRKRRAFQSVALLAAASVVFHLTKGIDYEEAASSLLLIGLLAAARSHFTVKSRRPDLKDALVRLSVAFVVAFGYGVAGFWLLPLRDFGVNFHIGQAVHHTLLILSLAGDPRIMPQTQYARWFVDSLYLMTVTALAYSGFALFRPVIYRYATKPKERAAAQEIASRYGVSGLDYFKTWEDKSYFFSPSRRSFLAYRVAANFAVVLGDPLGPAEEMEQIIGEFCRFCRDNDWGVAFYQAKPDLREAYRKAGFKALKIGDEAVVDLEAFSLEGKSMRAVRSAIRKLEKAGIHTRYIPAPLADEVLDALEEVSREWLLIDGRRERTFTLGRFDRAYLRNTPVLVVEDGEERALAFANLLPSGMPREITADLMRRRAGAPNGVMDFLFTKLFEHSRACGFLRFSLAMAPMAGFQDHERASAEERAVHAFFQRLNFIFNYKGLHAYKAKFATHWEPRYVYYRNVMQLPRLAIALGKVSTVKEQSDVEDGAGAAADARRGPGGRAGKSGQKYGLGARARDRRLLHSGGRIRAACAESAVRARRWGLERIRHLHGARDGVVGI